MAKKIETNYDAFAAWWERFEPELLRRTRGFLGVTEGVEDVVQDVALFASQNPGMFLDEDHLRRWATVRARWLAIDRLRVMGRTVDLTGFDVVAKPDASGLRVEILDALNRLPSMQKRIALMRLKGRTLREIAAALGIPKSTANRLWQEARYHLAKDFGSGGEP